MGTSLSSDISFSSGLGPCSIHIQKLAHLRTSRHLQRSSLEFNHCYSFSAVFLGFKGGALNQGVGLEKVSEAASERAGAVTVNDTHTRLIRECGLVEIFVDSLGG